MQKNNSGSGTSFGFSLNSIEPIFLTSMGVWEEGRSYLAKCLHPSKKTGLIRKRPILKGILMEFRYNMIQGSHLFLDTGENFVGQLCD